MKNSLIIAVLVVATAVLPGVAETGEVVFLGFVSSDFDSVQRRYIRDTVIRTFIQKDIPVMRPMAVESIIQEFGLETKPNPDDSLLSSIQREYGTSSIVFGFLYNSGESVKCDLVLYSPARGRRNVTLTLTRGKGLTWARTLAHEISLTLMKYLKE